MMAARRKTDTVTAWDWLVRYRHRLGFVGGIAAGLACALVPPHLAAPCQAVVAALSHFAGGGPQ
jgi:hypothetical protein